MYAQISIDSTHKYYHRAIEIPPVHAATPVSMKPGLQAHVDADAEEYSGELQSAPLNVDPVLAAALDATVPLPSSNL